MSQNKLTESQIHQEITEGEEELYKLKSEIKSRKKLIESMGGKSIDSQAINKKFTENENQIQLLQKQYDILQDRYQKIEEELSKLKILLKNEQKQNSELQQQIKQIHIDQDILQENNQQLNNSKQQNDEEYSNLDKKNQELQVENKKLLSQLQKAKDKIKKYHKLTLGEDQDIEESLDSSMQQQDPRELKLAQIIHQKEQNVNDGISKNFENQLKQQQLQIDDYIQQIKDQQNVISKNKQLEDEQEKKIIEQKTEIIELTKQLELQNQKHLKTTFSLEIEQQEKIDQLKLIHEKELKNLQLNFNNKFQTEKSEQELYYNEIIQKSKAKYQEQIVTLQQEINILSQQVTQSTNPGTNYDSNNGTLSTQTDDSQNFKNKLMEKTKLIDQISEERSSLQQQIQDLLDQIENSKKENQKQEIQIETQKSKLEEAKLKYQQLDIKILEKQNAIQEEKQKQIMTNQDMRQKDMKIKQFQTKIKLLEDQVSKQDKDIQQMQKVKSKLSNEVDNYKVQIKQLQINNNDIMKSQLPNLKKQVSDKNSEIQLLKEMVSSMKIVVRVKDQEIKKYKTQISIQNKNKDNQQNQKKLLQSPIKKADQNKYRSMNNNISNKSIINKSYSQNQKKSNRGISDLEATLQKLDQEDYEENPIYQREQQQNQQQFSPIVGQIEPQNQNNENSYNNYITQNHNSLLNILNQNQNLYQNNYNQNDMSKQYAVSEVNDSHQLSMDYQRHQQKINNSFNVLGQEFQYKNIPQFQRLKYFQLKQKQSENQQISSLVENNIQIKNPVSPVRNQRYNNLNNNDSPNIHSNIGQEQSEQMIQNPSNIFKEKPKLKKLPSYFYKQEQNDSQISKNNIVKQKQNENQNQFKIKQQKSEFPDINQNNIKLKSNDNKQFNNLQ